MVKHHQKPGPAEGSGLFYCLTDTQDLSSLARLITVPDEAPVEIMDVTPKRYRN
jgi:hypothetical protein